MLDDGTVLPELDRLFEPETSIGTAPYPYWTPTYTPSFQDNYCRRALYVSESFGPQMFCEVDAMEDSLFLACVPRQKLTARKSKSTLLPTFFSSVHIQSQQTPEKQKTPPLAPKIPNILNSWIRPQLWCRV